ncbi:MAG: pyridoxal-phosphate dependent enzyme [Kangiellaceae bacterium]|nr:pyridoxal-phosphate dependent enzyme [Kangiellaceae bacterium]MCW9018158.1 pyridoxal-phosphate dependent enzyme [Kangiellaceae bacterium]
MNVRQVSHLYSLLRPSNIQEIYSPLLSSHQVRLFVKRDDAIHSVISGNKWRKIKHLLHHVEQSGFSKVASMGGRYSNFLHALSYVCKHLNWHCDCYVRGYPQQSFTPMLQDIKGWGARLIFCDKQEFRNIRQQAPNLPKDVFWIPEGGFSELAVKGVKETFYELPLDKNAGFDYLVSAAATGTTLAGYLKGIEQLKRNVRIVGVRVLNNDDEIEEKVRQLTKKSINSTEFDLVRGYEFGGFAKRDERLEQFITSFESIHAIPIEPVYSGKSFFATFDLIQQGYFKPGSRILLVHCGGLQGKRT